MVIDIPIIKPEELTYTEITEVSEDIKKEEKRRKKAEKDYLFNETDMKEMNQRLASGEDLDEVISEISIKGMARLSEKKTVLPPIRKEPSRTIPPVIKPPTIQPPVIKPPTVQPPVITEPTIHPPVTTKPIKPTKHVPLYILEERERKIAEKEAKKILRTVEQRIDYPEEECCSSVCNIMNDEIGQYLGDASGDKDIKLKFDTLRELRRQFYIQDACQCANGNMAQRTGIPLLEKQHEDCCPKVCNILNNAIEGYEGILFPTHAVRIKSETVYDIRTKMFHNACKCVETEEQLKKPRPGGQGMDPVLQNRLLKLLKYADKEGWIRDGILLKKTKTK
jgi:hypothetical protein